MIINNITFFLFITVTVAKNQSFLLDVNNYDFNCELKKGMIIGYAKRVQNNRNELNPEVLTSKLLEVGGSSPALSLPSISR